jgi:hypothetical protein
MGKPDFQEQLAQCLGKFAFQAMKEAGLKINVNEEPIVKNLGGFYSDSAHFTEAPRYLAFSPELPEDNEEKALEISKEIERKMKKFVHTINRDFNLKDNPLEVDFDRDYEGRLRMVCLKIEPLLEQPRLLAQIVTMLNRRHFMGGSLTALVGVQVYLLSDKSKNDTVRWVGKSVGVGSVVLGGAQMLTPLMQPTLKDWDGFVETFRKSLENDRSPDK